MRALLEGIKVLNKELVELCELAEWNVVEIDRDLNLRMTVVCIMIMFAANLNAYDAT